MQLQERAADALADTTAPAAAASSPGVAPRAGVLSPAAATKPCGRREIVYYAADECILVDGEYLVRRLPAKILPRAQARQVAEPAGMEGQPREPLAPLAAAAGAEVPGRSDRAASARFALETASQIALATRTVVELYQFGLQAFALPVSCGRSEQESQNGGRGRFIPLPGLPHPGSQLGCRCSCALTV